ncbi:hypothetical protein HJFPF1_03926 [Paramyrothecium foliicola]|nr:hypothetical protein HJFPF1_03926 [Paramyrothecium foliicola]
MLSQQQICSAATFLCYLRVIPLWIVAVLGLALLSARAYFIAATPAKEPGPRRNTDQRKLGHRD